MPQQLNTDKEKFSLLAFKGPKKVMAELAAKFVFRLAGVGLKSVLQKNEVALDVIKYGFSFIIPTEYMEPIFGLIEGKTLESCINF